MKAETFAGNASILNDATKDALDLNRCNNQVYVSSLNYLAPFSYTSLFSIKYVHDGLERYRVNGVNNKLEKGHCLIVNNESTVLSECGTGKNPDEINLGMSIFLTPLIISEVLEVSKTRTKDILEEHNTVLSPVMFYDGIIKNDPFVDYLKNQFSRLSVSSGGGQLEESYYYAICENLLQFQYNISRRLDGINKVKHSTKQEILKRVLVAKEIMDDNYLKNLDLDYLARQCCLSKYFLIKSFKQVFNITPHQYHIRLKINHAKKLLQHKSLSVSEVAHHLNYPDIFSFSRQFRLVTQYPPSVFKNLCK
ncbi:MAG: helix-turn-helix domain-containing protein [Ginsengibacter sp.]